MTTLSVLTLNIWNYEGEWAERAALIRDWIGLLDPDLIALQEVLRGPSIDQAGLLLDQDVYHLHYEPMFDYWGDTTLAFGNLVASRWPLARAERLLLSSDDDAEPRNAISVDVEAPLTRLSFTTTHLSPRPWHSRIRSTQVVHLAELVKRRAFDTGMPAILCGDFNAQPDADEIRFMKGLHTIQERSFFMVDAWDVGGPGERGATFTARNLSRTYTRDVRLDYIFVSRDDIRVQRCDLACHLPRRGIYPSDHFGLYAELTLHAA